jgi:hypothetical protein
LDRNKLQRAQGVLALDGAVVEVDFAVAHLQVEERKPHRLGVRRRGLCRRQASDDVVDVVVARPGAREAQPGCVDLDGLDHRRQPQQRTHVGIDVQPRDFEQGRARGASGRPGQRKAA